MLAPHLPSIGGLRWARIAPTRAPLSRPTPHRDLVGSTTRRPLKLSFGNWVTYDNHTSKGCLYLVSEVHAVVTVRVNTRSHYLCAIFEDWTATC